MCPPMRTTAPRIRWITTRCFARSSWARAPASRGNRPHLRYEKWASPMGRQRGATPGNLREGLLSRRDLPLRRRGATSPSGGRPRGRPAAATSSRRSRAPARPRTEARTLARRAGPPWRRRFRCSRRCILLRASRTPGTLVISSTAGMAVAAVVGPGRPRRSPTASRTGRGWTRAWSSPAESRMRICLHLRGFAGITIAQRGYPLRTRAHWINTPPLWSAAPRGRPGRRRKTERRGSPSRTRCCWTPGWWTTPTRRTSRLSQRGTR
mmetsp:Transcript_37257/g.93488  ORF Transcript_37257/g.93488 Transcript_37257/m.93488 type:complete len:266 (+) Transcript_37257:474-1271(+)